MYKSCPNCKITWEGETIPEGLYQTGYYGSIRECELVAECYGWTPENNKRFGVNHVGIETPDYDGVSYWECCNCQARFDRWKK